MNYKKIFKDPAFWGRAKMSIGKKLKIYDRMSDEEFLKKRYEVLFQKELNLETPKTFNEKLQWLKLHNRKPEYTIMVDKYLAKKYVADIIGEEYIIPTLGVWDKFEDINFSELPSQFVLKCTHDSGGLVICRDKDNFDLKKAEKNIKKSLKRNFYLVGREWPYKNVKPRIIAEKYMEDSNSKQGLIDYKFYCFNGKPEFLYVSQGLENHNTAKISFVTMDWKLAPYERGDFDGFEKLPAKPVNWDEMKEICCKLSENIPFLRVDLYEIEGKVYFSELTFSPTAGFMRFKNPQHDLELGNLIELPNIFNAE